MNASERPDWVITDLQLRWDNAAHAKARHRDEVVRRFLALPLAEWLRETLSLMQPARRDPSHR